MDWQLEQQNIEIRYSNGFLYWDRSGMLASKLCGLNPLFTVDEASPGKVSFTDKSTDTTVIYSYESTRIGRGQPHDGTKVIGDLADAFLPFMLDQISIQVLTRVGHRMIFHCEFPDEKSAINWISNFLRSKGGVATLFSGCQDSRLVDKHPSDFRARFEDEKTGITVALNKGSLSLNVQGAAAYRLRPHVPPDIYYATLDIDVYTRVPMSCDDFAPQELMRSNRKMAETRILPLFHQ